MGNIVKLKNVRLSFPDLFRAKPFKQGDVPKYKATFLFEKGSENDKIVKAAIIEAAKASKWGNKYKEVLEDIKGNPNKFCYQDGDKKKYDGYKGMMAVTASSKVRPLIIDRDKTPLTEDDNKIHGGYYVNANIEFFGYSNSGNGLAASLSGVQFYKIGELFSGSSISDPDDFEEVEDSEDDDDTAGLV